MHFQEVKPNMFSIVLKWSYCIHSFFWLYSSICLGLKVSISQYCIWGLSQVHFILQGTIAKKKKKIKKKKMHFSVYPIQKPKEPNLTLP